MDLQVDGLDAVRRLALLHVAHRRLGYMSLYRRDTTGEEKQARMDLPDWTAQEDEAVDPEDWAERVVNWVHEAVTTAYEADPRPDHLMRFRLRLYGPKGAEHLGNIALAARGEEEPLRPGSAETPSVRPAGFPRAITDSAEANAFKEHQESLGLAYNNFVAFVLSVFQDLMRQVHHREEHTSADLARARAQNDRLLASIINLKMDAVESREAQVKAQSAQSQEAVAQQMLRELRETVQTVAMGAQGLPPNVQRFMQFSKNSPELASILENPMLEKVLENPARKKMFMALIQQVLAQILATEDPGPSGIPPVPGSSS